MTADDFTTTMNQSHTVTIYVQMSDDDDDFVYQKPFERMADSVAMQAEWAAKGFCVCVDYDD